MKIEKEFFLLCGIIRVCQGLDFMGTSNQNHEITFLTNHKTESLYWYILGNPFKENTCNSPWTCGKLKIYIYEFPQLKWFYGKGWIVVYKGGFYCIFNDFNFLL